MAVSLLCLLYCALSRTASADEVFDIWHGRYRVTYEDMVLPGREAMGLAGVQYLIDLSSNLYGGIGFFGAVSGHRGGFFTGGINAGARFPVFSRFVADAGMFIGGGGGRGAPQGGGLMLRPHVGLLYNFDHLHAGLALSLVDYPNGEIRSSHVAAMLDFPFDELRVPRNRDRDPATVLMQASAAAGREIVFTPQHIAVRHQLYRPTGARLNTDQVTQTEPFSLTGFEYGSSMGNGSYLLAQIAGAAGGSSGGYAEVFFGTGMRFPLFGNTGSTGSTLFDARIAAGAGGGGGVDTGNGIMTKTGLGLFVMTSRDTGLGIQYGLVDSAGGFRAQTAEVSLVYASEAASFGTQGKSTGIMSNGLRLDAWRIRFGHQQYRNVSDTMRKNGISGNLSLINVKIDKEFDGTPLYLTGQALSAYAGGAGGYAAGLMGIGIASGPLADTRMRAFTEALGGEGGGGGLDVAGGAVAQIAAGLMYELPGNVGIELALGRLRSLHGPLDTATIDFGITYRFATIGKQATGL